MPEGDVVLEVPAPASGIATDHFMDIRDGLPLVDARFATRGQTVCIPTLKDNSIVVMAALDAGCTVIGADDDQSLIDDVVREVSLLQGDSSSDDKDAQ